MEFEINEFNQLFFKNSFFEPNNNQLLTLGTKIVQSSVNDDIKIDIIYNLITIYPNNYLLYYWMGYLHLTLKPNNAFYWFKQCYKINPLYIENLLDMLKILFDTDQFLYMQKINDDNNNIMYESTDLRMRLIVASYTCKQKQFNQSINMYHKLLEETELTITDRIICNSNIGITCNDVSNYKKSMYHLETAVDLFITQPLGYKIENNIDNAMFMFNNLFLVQDYVYNDVNEMFDRYLKLDRLLIKHNNYDFHSHKQNSKIRIGYLSGDYNGHSVSNFIHPILKNHTDLFEIHCFSIAKIYKPIPYNITNHNVRQLNIQDLADYIYKQKINILIDLAGHTFPNRLEVFTLNSAPIQVTYLGFPNTTGLSSIKYRITDSIADNMDSLQKYSEQLYRLPKCFLLFEDIYKLSQPKPRITPSDCIVLGSLNRENKTSFDTLHVWKTILTECENTKLLILLKSHINEEICIRTKYYCDKLNVSEDRLIITPYVDGEHGYNKLFEQIDIILDPFPYSGTTTTCKALLHSIPVVTKYHKDYHSHNVSASLLINSGVPELVAYTDDEYVEIVKSLVSNPLKIDDYKDTIKDKFGELMNPGEFMKSYEKMFLDMYNEQIK
jgi:predicted O-linked N-acetylglucosamine transferase (SPINDLY family)